MSRYLDLEKITVESSDLCDCPEQLLRSRRFAEFLSFFNRSERMLRGKEVVVPDQVAKCPKLAKEVFIYYLHNRALVPMDPAEDREWIDELAERTYVEVKRWDADREMQLARAGRKAVKEVLEGEEEYDVDTPDWIRALAPDCQKTIPVHAAEELERAFQRWYAICTEGSDDGQLGKRVLSTVMNNFRVYFCHMRRQNGDLISGLPLSGDIDKKMGDVIRGCSPRMAGKTWREFYGEVDRVLQEKGLSAESLVGMNSTEANLTLLPVFLELLKMGYRLYPDLTM